VKAKQSIKASVLALLAVASLMTPMSAPGANAAGTPSLMFEHFFGSFLDPAQPACDTSSTSTVTYTESGPADGPYPGTYTETGTFTIGPQPVPGLSVPLIAFHATFHIESLVGQVDGTKELLVAGPPNGGRCFTLLNEPLDPVFCQGATPCLATIETVDFQTRATYQATITAVTGSFSESGTASVLGFRRSQRTPCCASKNEAFSESFTTSNGLVPLDAAAVTLSPATAINTVGGSHTVTATATNVLLQPVANATVLFTVQGSVTTAGSCTTGSNGQCSFTYQGPQLPGADLIRGCADNNRNGLADPTEPCGEATKIWMLPATTPGQVTGGGWIEKLGGGRVSFGFNARSDGTTVKGNCNLIDHAMSAHIKCLTVDSLVVAATHATFFGQASIDGITTTYRIDVDDLGEPGTQDTFKIQTDSGYIAGGVLAGGNIQIHN
jgi:hypothetical protein